MGYDYVSESVEQRCLLYKRPYKQPNSVKLEYRDKIFIFLILSSLITFVIHIFYGSKLLLDSQDFGHNEFKKVHCEYNVSFLRNLLSNILIFGINEEEKGPHFSISEYLYLESYMKKAFIGQHIVLNQVLMQFQQLITSYDKPIVHWKRLWVWNLIGDTGLGKSHLINVLTTALEKVSCANIIYSSLFYKDNVDEIERNVIKQLVGACFNFLVLEEVRDPDHVIEPGQLAERDALLVDRLARHPSRDLPADSALVVVAMTTSGSIAVDRLNEAYARHMTRHAPVEHVIRAERSHLTRESFHPIVGVRRHVIIMAYLPFHNFHIVDCIKAQHFMSGRSVDGGEEIRSWPYFAKINMTHVAPKGCKNLKAIFSLQHYNQFKTTQ